MNLDLLDATPPAPEATPETTAIPEVLLADTSFLCGAAGVGKTWLARAMAAQLPGTRLCAVTGIASVNLGEGTTINSELGYFDTQSLKDSYTSGFLTARLGKLWKSGVRRLLIDETSMMDADQLTVITRALDELGGRGYVLDADLSEDVDTVSAQEGRSTPIAITIVADMCQLPPVKAPYAFESPEWGRYAANTVKLTEIRRQSDHDFITALQACRRGDAAEVIEYFRSRLETTTDHDFDGPTIMATNDAVARFNQLRLDKVHGDVVRFSSTRWGTVRGDWKQIPEILTLKTGALVMILANARDPITKRMIYANGDLATLTHVDGTHVYVTLQRTGKEVVIDWVTRENTVPLEPGRKKQLIADGTPERVKDRFEVIGGVTYLPLRVAYASTVHRSQGLSLDKVQVNTREGFFKTPSMLYVALSRARTVEGLRLIGTVDGLRERCTVDARIREWL